MACYFYEAPQSLDIVDIKFSKSLCQYLSRKTTVVHGKTKQRRRSHTKSTGWITESKGHLSVVCPTKISSWWCRWLVMIIVLVLVWTTSMINMLSQLNYLIQLDPNKTDRRLCKNFSLSWNSLQLKWASVKFLKQEPNWKNNCEMSSKTIKSAAPQWSQCSKSYKAWIFPTARLEIHYFLLVLIRWDTICNTL